MIWNRLPLSVQYRKKALSALPDSPCGTMAERGILFGSDKRGRNPGSKISLIRTDGQFFGKLKGSHMRAGM